MKKTLLLSVFSLLVFNLGFSQTEKAWSQVADQNIKKNKNVERESFPQDFKLMQLNVSTLKQVLLNAPDRFSGNAKGVVITLPNSQGELERFEVFEASNFDAVLQAQFPEIRAYAGNGIDDKYARVRISLDPRGIQTMVSRADKGSEFMEPYSTDGKVYAVYNSSRVKGKLPFTCSTPEQTLVNDLSNDIEVSRSSTGQLKTFRLALSCTGEYANYFLATSGVQVALVNAAFNATMTRVNGIFEQDFAIHMNIVATNNNVIFYNPATDPYSPSASMANWNSELQSTLTSVIGEANYDVGHLFGADGGGGNAGCIGCVCVNGSKGSGITSPADAIPMGDNFDVDYVAHELGHQFGANHTFSNSNEGQGVNKEVGSGVTIMGYAGITAQDTHLHSIDVFHSASIAQVQANMVGKTCPVNTTITHSAPVVNAGGNWTIPLSTPFVLTGSATDAGGTSTMTFTWEQNDDGGANTGAASAASPTKTTGPNWVNYVDSASPVRYFPIMSSILGGSTTTAGLDVTAEALSSVARTLNFRLTARDNVAGLGQTNFANAVVTVANKTALTVTMAPSTSYPVGSTQTVVWTGATGASGHSTIAGGANVDILFSSDNGVTWSTLLAGTLNDGSEVVTLPAGVAAPYCRFMVKASANIFFNISASFSVGYTISTSCNSYVMNTGFAIPDNNTAYTIRSINVPTSASVSDVNLAVNLTHTWISDINIALVDPLGVNQINIINGSCTNNDNINATFDDQGSPIVCAATITGNVIPAQALSIYNGSNPNGDWLVGVRDLAAADTGSVVSYTLTICSSVVALASESFGIEGFSLYPNPNNGTFNIQFTSSSSNEIKVNVHDMRGREIFNKAYQNNGLFNESLQLNNVQAGIYLVTVQDGSRKEVKKIIVE
jgi:subtilisin-like proprotein convertase family protein